MRVGRDAGDELDQDPDSEGRLRLEQLPEVPTGLANSGAPAQGARPRLVSFAKYHGAVQLGLDAADTARLASRLRLGVTRLARRLRREAEAGISPSQLSALATVERHGPMTMGDLCDAEHVQPPTMTRIVAALVEAGLLERWGDPDDRRVSWVRVTPRGARLLARARSRKDAYLARRLRSLDPRELAVLEEAAGILERLVEERP